VPGAEGAEAGTGEQREGSRRRRRGRGGRDRDDARQANGVPADLNGGAAQAEGFSAVPADLNLDAAPISGSTVASSGAEAANQVEGAGPENAEGAEREGGRRRGRNRPRRERREDEAPSGVEGAAEAGSPDAPLVGAAFAERDPFQARADEREPRVEDPREMPRYETPRETPRYEAPAIAEFAPLPVMASAAPVAAPVAAVATLVSRPTHASEWLAASLMA